MSCSWERQYVVYFIKVDNYVKIGYTGNLEERIKAIQIMSPFDIEILGCSVFESRRDAFRAEQLIQMILIDHVHTGEWFLLGSDILLKIKNLSSKSLEELERMKPGFVYMIKSAQTKKFNQLLEIYQNGKAKDYKY